MAPPGLITVDETGAARLALGNEALRQAEVHEVTAAIAPTAQRTASQGVASKLLAGAGLVVVELLVFFKFVPDLGTGVIQGQVSTLTDFRVFADYFMQPGSVFRPRFLGNEIVFHLAQLIGHFVHSTDVRLHPLRLAAAAQTAVFSLLGLAPIFSRHWPAWLDWRSYFAAYSCAVLVGLYVFYPGDMPSIAFIALGTYFVLTGRRFPALVMMLLAGLFRESAFHLVAIVAIWAATDHQPKPATRATWVVGFAAGFAVEYEVIRWVLPGPVSSTGGLILNPVALFLDRGLFSLTTICSLALAALYPIVYLRVIGKGSLEQRIDQPAWTVNFFRWNALALPLWVVFYRVLNGNISEFRLLIPCLVPLFFALALRGAPARMADATSTMPIATTPPRRSRQGAIAT